VVLTVKQELETVQKSERGSSMPSIALKYGIGKNDIQPNSINKYVVDTTG
jgi:hypothetical protein